MNLETQPHSRRRTDRADAERDSSRARRRAGWWMAAGGVLGAGLGFAYYYFVGCQSGHCLIGANPFLSLLFGGVFGVGLAGLLTAPGP